MAGHVWPPPASDCEPVSAYYRTTGSRIMSDSGPLRPAPPRHIRLAEAESSTSTPEPLLRRAGWGGCGGVKPTDPTPGARRVCGHVAPRRYGRSLARDAPRP